MDAEAFTTWQLRIHQLTNIQMCKLPNLNQPYYYLDSNWAGFFMCQTLNHESRSQWPLQMVLKENMVLIFLTYEKLLIIFSMKNGFKRKELSHYQRQAF